MKADPARLSKWAEDYYRRSTPYANHLSSKWNDEWLKHFGQYADAIRKYSSASSVILDLGCGAGQSTCLLSDACALAVGLDMSLHSLNGFLSEKKKENLFFVNGTSLELPFKSASFDVVASYCLLEHLPDAERGLEEMLRVLKPGGILVVDAPNMISPFRSIRLMCRRIKGGKVHPDGTLSAVIKCVSHVARRAFSSSPRFEYRDPLVNGLDFLGSDFDAVHYSNPIDLRHYARRRNLKVLSVSRYTSSLGRVVATVTPYLAGGMRFVVQKGEAGNGPDMPTSSS